MWLTVGNEGIDLANRRRPQWTLARASTLAEDLYVGLPVPLRRGEVEIGYLKLRRFFGTRPRVVEEQQQRVIAASLCGRFRLAAASMASISGLSR